MTHSSCTLRGPFPSLPLRRSPPSLPTLHLCVRTGLGRLDHALLHALVLRLAVNEVVREGWREGGREGRGGREGGTNECAAAVGETTTSTRLSISFDPAFAPSPSVSVCLYYVLSRSRLLCTHPQSPARRTPQSPPTKGLRSRPVDWAPPPP